MPVAILAKLELVQPPLAGLEPTAVDQSRPPPQSASPPTLSLQFLILPLFLSFFHPHGTLYANGMAGHHGRPNLHRTVARRRWRSPAKARARRGGGHAAGPKPRIEPAVCPILPLSSPLSLNSGISPDAVLGADEIAGQGSGPARRRARCRSRTKIGTGAAMASVPAWPPSSSLSLSLPSYYSLSLGWTEAYQRHGEDDEKEVP